MLGLLKQYLWVLHLVAIIFTSYFGARLVNLYLGEKIAIETDLKAPETAVSQADAFRKIAPASEYQPILERNIFDSSEKIAEAVPTTPADFVPTGEAVKTGLSIQVLGVLVIGEGKDPRSTATVASGTTIDTYAVGDENGFAPNTKLVQVKPDRIEFIHNGRLEYALFEDEVGASIFGPPTEGGEAAAPAAPAAAPGSTIKQEGEGKFVIDQKEVQEALNNMERLYTEIRAVPNFAGGKVSGMKILSVKQGSLFDKLGLRRGDILSRINGLELDVKRGFEIFNQLKSEKHLTVDLVRQGTNQTFEYEIR